ncbi:thiol-disulfide oxidoreductase [Formosa agariphila KMM 3901]|uniref:Thiol-disulfide oxidoreductase n=1 Tax=Formosa agariphila (strain DSM 15362 / KCTC 12365 / LMG 23005 / KMM 3901 / M-2Alg 35-1) TaxID=1347342 RepID=T2KGF9_FORAG|nr:TlpA disulfide reductase family protein [Formosa agariphila]CDF77835.1 thiol-disulfide oxidoreductase [Formosa agariphila KMM 3901]
MKNLLIAFFLLPTLLLAQHKISGTFSPADQFKAAILYKLEPSNSLYIDNADIVNGHFELNLDASLKPGMYQLVYALPQDQYNFNFIYNNEDIVFKYDLEHGATYNLSKENKLLSNYRREMLAAKNKINTFYGKSNQDKAEYAECISELKAIQDKAEADSKGMLAYEFIKAEKPYIPTSYEDAQTYFNNYKSKYFDSINFSNPTLQNSDLLIDSALKYIFIFVDKRNENASYKRNIDDVVRVTSKEKMIQKSILEVSWNQFKNRNNEEVANYIASEYLEQLLDPVKDELLISDMKAFQNTAIGAVAPDFSWPSKLGSTKLSQLKGKDYYIVTFWSSTCSHCLTELPVLKSYMSDKNNIQVLAIGLEDERPNWEKTIADYPEFTQIYGYGKWENPIPIAYGVAGTPSFFVLDKDKKIIAKPDDVEELISFLKTKK